MRRFLIACFAAIPVLLSAQAPTATPPERPSAGPASVDGLPVRRVVLYKTGVGYFEHLGTVRNRQDVMVRFTSAQLDDVLNSLTVLDLGRGQITGISYNSVAPLEQRLNALRLPLGESTTQFEMLQSLRGARVEVTSAGAAIQGRLLSVEQRSRQRGDETTTMDSVAVITDYGELRSFELSPSTHVRIIGRDLRQEVGRYLDVVGSTRERDVRSMVISTRGAGDRQLFVSYVSEVPIWKSTYRLVLNDKGRPLVQGWAVIDNTIGEDWRNVELSLVAGAPQSFIQHISQPYYGRRLVVPMPSSLTTAPQTHQASLGKGVPGGVEGGLPGGVVGGVVGGMPAAPAPPAPIDIYSHARVAAPQATGGSIGDLFEYRIKEPVTLRKNQSALVPILSAEIDAEKVSLWNRPSGSGRPLRAVWLTNSSGLTLDGGSVSVIDADAFAGEGLIEPLKPGEKRLLSYATDLGVLVDARTDQEDSRIVRLRAYDGIMIQETEERVTSTYRARNQNTTSATLIIEHRLGPDWQLLDGQTPAETTVDAKRFRIVLPPGKETVHEVREVRRGETQISVGTVDDVMIAQLAKSGISASALESALKPMLDKKAELARTEQRLALLQKEQAAIAADQQRVRENMKALRGSAEEKQLLQRYTRQLDEQETTLETLRTEVTRLTAEIETLRKELSALIASVSFELTQ